MSMMILANVLALAGVSPVSAFPAKQQAAGFVEFPLFKTDRNGPNTIKAPLFDGRDFIEAKLDNKQFYYQIELGIGNPPQMIDFTIDTGSSDLWVMAASNPYCTTNASNQTGVNCTGSVFNPELSKTFLSLDREFSIDYGDHTMANGTMALDTIRIGNFAISNTTFAVANVVNSSTCVFGIGFIGNEAEAHVHRNGTGVYPTYFNVPTMMKENNLISTNAYSLWLNDVDSEQGSILFGGVDRSKYEGDLFVMPVFNNYHEYTDRPTQTRVMLNGISADRVPIVDFNIAVLLDSGTSFSYLPGAIVDAIGNAIGFNFDETLGYFFGSIDTAAGNVEKLNLDFSGATIDIPIANLLVGLTLNDGVTPLVIDGEEQAILAMGKADSDYLYILGDVFLRSMYAVFDIDHYEIALAQAKMNVTDEDIITIGASIPGAVQAPSYAFTFPNNSSFSTIPFTPATPALSSMTFNLSTFTGTLLANTTKTLNSVKTLTSTSSSTTNCEMKMTSGSSAADCPSSTSKNHHTRSRHTRSHRYLPTTSPCIQSTGLPERHSSNSDSSEWTIAPDGELIPNWKYEQLYGKHQNTNWIHKEESRHGPCTEGNTEKPCNVLRKLWNNFKSH